MIIKLKLKLCFLPYFHHLYIKLFSKSQIKLKNQCEPNGIHCIKFAVFSEFLSLYNTYEISYQECLPDRVVYISPAVIAVHHYSSYCW